MYGRDMSTTHTTLTPEQDSSSTRSSQPLCPFCTPFFVVGSILPSSSSWSGTSCCEGVDTFFSMSTRVTFQTFGPMIGAKTKQTSHQVASPLNSCLMICSPVKPFKASRRTLPLANMSRWIYTMVDGVFGSMCTSITCDASLALPAPFSNNVALSK